MEITADNITTYANADGVLRREDPMRTAEKLAKRVEKKWKAAIDRGAVPVQGSEETMTYLASIDYGGPHIYVENGNIYVGGEPGFQEPNLYKLNLGETWHPSKKKMGAKIEQKK